MAEGWMDEGLEDLPEVFMRLLNQPETLRV